MLRSSEILVGETSVLAKIFFLLNQWETAISFYLGGGGEYLMERRKVPLQQLSYTKSPFGQNENNWYLKTSRERELTGPSVFWKVASEEENIKLLRRGNLNSRNPF